MAHIMVVEDEPITAADLEQTLVSVGHELSGWADTGEEAVDQARKLAPDLVLMDIRLRGTMTGIEAAERIRREADIPVVFLTAFADRDTVDRACQTHPYGYLVKPFTERAVAAAIETALARVAAERSSLARERFMATALRSLGEALVAVDNDGAIRFLNARAEQLLRAERGAVIGRAADAIVRLTEAEATGPAKPFELALREGRVTSSPGGARLGRADGTEVTVSYSAAPMLGPRGEKEGAVLVFREESSSPDVASLTRRLQHEINNPLTYNLGALRLARKELDTLRTLGALGPETAPIETNTGRRDARLDRIDQLLETAHEGATRVAAVMAELRQATSARRERAPLKLDELVDVVIGSCAAVLDQVRLERRDGSAPMILADRWQLARAIADELTCAVARRGAGGEAARAVELELATGTDAHGWAEVRILVRGAPERARSEAADADERERRGVVAAHGGSLLLRDVPEGLAIEVRLPPMTVVTEPPRPAVQREASPRASVLVVDDEPMIGRVLEIALKRDHDVTAVDSAESALALLERGDAFDIILCDLSMPGMGGRGLYERLRATRPDLAARVVLMSGGASTAEDERFLASMGERRLDKPFRADQLAPLITEQMRARKRDPLPT